VADRILIGKVSGASGIKGEIKLFHYSGERERIAGIGELYLSRRHGEATQGAKAQGEETGLQRAEILSMRYTGKTPILRVKGIETREAAEALIGAEVYAHRDSLAPLGTDSYYVEELIGFGVRDESGERIGTVAGILDNPAHDILRIEPTDGGKEILLPMVDSFVASVDERARKITVRLPEGIADA
jgi:16S rRNA processing protein RimM